MVFVVFIIREVSLVFVEFFCEVWVFERGLLGGGCEDCNEGDRRGGGG